MKNKKRAKKSFHKLYFYFLITLLVFAIGLIANAAIDITKPWHELQQIAKNKSIMISVDENRDNVIDEAETLA